MSLFAWEALWVRIFGHWTSLKGGDGQFQIDTICEKMMKKRLSYPPLLFESSHVEVSYLCSFGIKWVMHFIVRYALSFGPFTTT